MGWAEALRCELSARNQQVAIEKGPVHEVTTGEMPSVIFRRGEDGLHGNFYPSSFLRESR